MLSRGVPMLLGGDEIRRTQGGNNNAVQPGQRDELVRLDDGRLEPGHAAVRSADDRVPQGASGALGSPHFYTGEINERGVADITWHGTKLGQPGLRRSDWAARSRARSPGFDGDADLHVMMNMFWEPLDFEVPVDPQRVWHVAVDTFMASPHDIAEPNAGAPFVVRCARCRREAS